MTTPLEIERDDTQTWVTMYHPELPDSPRSVVTSQAFHMLWASRGWQLLTDEQAAQSEALGRTITETLSPEDQAQYDALTRGAAPPTFVTEVPFVDASEPNPVSEDDPTATATPARKRSLDVKEQ